MKRWRDLSEEELRSAVLGFQRLLAFALLTYFFQHDSIITVHSFPCTPAPSRCFIMHMLKEKVSVHTVSLHLASGISLCFGKNNLSNSAIKYTGGRKKMKLQECVLVLTFHSNNELKVNYLRCCSRE
jgi:hypothetical protein